MSNNPELVFNDEARPYVTLTTENLLDPLHSFQTEVPELQEWIKITRDNPPKDPPPYDVPEEITEELANRSFLELQTELDDLSDDTVGNEDESP